MTEKDRVLCSVDIGSSKIVTLIVSVGENERINLIGASSVPSKGIKKGQIVDIESASQAIIKSLEGAERMAGISISSAYVSISGTHIESTNTHAVIAVSQRESDIDLKDLARLDRIARAISLPQKEILHALPVMYTIDGQTGIKNPLGMFGNRLEVKTHIIAGSTIAISNLVKCFSRVGVNIEEIVFSGIASSKAVLTETEKALGVVLIDIGYETTAMTVFFEDALIYSSVIPIGARFITNDMAVGLKVSLESAEKIKHKLADYKEDVLDLKELGITEDTDKISIKFTRDTIMKARIREILELVKKEIKKSGFGNIVPFGVVMCGGGALTAGILEQSKPILGFSARVGEIEGFSGLSEEIDSPAFATASGLILYAVEQSANSKSENTLGFNKHLPGLIKDWFSKLIQSIRSVFK
ncbi:MAG: cell division protein FtsA [Candidatus Daviesbacteria bacterium]|nr:cell division protein FtsA [Candidatus Daviesbacteria bacterium]